MTVVERVNSIAPPCDDGCEVEMIEGLLVLKLVGGNLCVLVTVRLSSGVWEMGATCNLPSRLWEIITYRKRRRNWSEGQKPEAISKPQSEQRWSFVGRNGVAQLVSSYVNWV